MALWLVRTNPLRAGVLTLLGSRGYSSVVGRCWLLLLLLFAPDHIARLGARGAPGGGGGRVRVLPALHDRKRRGVVSVVHCSLLLRLLCWWRGRGGACGRDARVVPCHGQLEQGTATAETVRAGAVHLLQVARRTRGYSTRRRQCRCIRALSVYICTVTLLSELLSGPWPPQEPAPAARGQRRD